MHDDPKHDKPTIGSDSPEMIDEEHDFLGEPPGDSSMGYETQEFLKPRRVVSFVAFLVVMAVASIVGMRILETYWAKGAGPTPDPSPFADQRTQLADSPLLQAEPQRDMDELREAEGKRVNQYGWIDQGAGLAHIPVDRAMDIVLSEGLPYRGEAAQEPPPEAQPENEEATQ